VGCQPLSGQDGGDCGQRRRALVEHLHGGRKVAKAGSEHDGEQAQRGGGGLEDGYRLAETDLYDGWRRRLLAAGGGVKPGALGRRVIKAACTGPKLVAWFLTWGFKAFARRPGSTR
jgi:hypothetical protein